MPTTFYVDQLGSIYMGTDPPHPVRSGNPLSSEIRPEISDGTYMIV